VSWALLPDLNKSYSDSDLLIIRASTIDNKPNHNTSYTTAWSKCSSSGWKNRHTTFWLFELFYTCIFLPRRLRAVAINPVTVRTSTVQSYQPCL